MAPSLRNPVEVDPNRRELLLAAQVRHRDAMERAGQCAAELRRLVVEAVDAGMSQKGLAKLLNVSRSRIHQILYTEGSRA